MKFGIHSLLLLLLFIGGLTGCGTYRVNYIMPSQGSGGHIDELTYRHGWGLMGGGGFFFAIHRMVPCWADYTGRIKLDQQAPDGVCQVEQYQNFGQNTIAAFISWLILVNPYQESTVIVHHAKPLNTFAPPA